MKALRKAKKSLGMATVEPTVDPEFDEKKKEFDFTMKALKQLLTKTEQFMKSTSNIKACKEVNDSLVIADAPAISSLLGQQVSAANELNTAHEELETTLTETVISPLKSYLDQFSTMQSRLKIRDNKVKSFDSARLELCKAEGAKNKDKMAIKVANTKVTHCEPVYEKVNVEVVSDLTNLLAAVPDFMMHILANWTAVQRSYYDSCAASFAKIDISDQDLSAFSEVPRYIVSDDDSVLGTV